jgi:Carbohydrate binding domain
MNLKILSGENYKIQIKRMLDNRIMEYQNIRLNGGESADIVLTNQRVNLCKGKDFNTAFGPWTLNPMGAKVRVDGAQNWRFILREKEGADIAVENDYCHIKLTNFMTNKNSAVLAVRLLTLEKGKRYRLSFSAKAASPRQIYYRIFKLDAPAASYLPVVHPKRTAGFKNMTITTEMKTYSDDFTMVKPTDNHPVLVLGFGNSSTDIWVGDVWVEEIE